MNRSYVLLVVGIVGLTALLPAAPAAHCEDPWLDRDTNEVTIYEDGSVWVRGVTPEPVGVRQVYYIEIDACGGEGCNVFLYEETNAFQNLQRGGEGPGHDGGVDDTCHGYIKSDAIVL